MKVWELIKKTNIKIKEVFNMSNKDGTGPKGQGPKDGRGDGKGNRKSPGEGPKTGGKKGIKEEPKK